jgi:FAD/FMN-containing dehydrogenase
LETARKEGKRVKPVGRGHSFNDIADTDGIQISMENFKGIEIDLEKGTVWIEAGVDYCHLVQHLD